MKAMGDSPLGAYQEIEIPVLCSVSTMLRCRFSCSSKNNVANVGGQRKGIGITRIIQVLVARDYEESGWLATRVVRADDVVYVKD